MHPEISHAPAVTALILCGGQGSRLGGVDKGLQPWQGRPLVEHVLQAIRPQVQQVLISANRHADHYRRYGHPVLADTIPGYIGPLGGMLAGLQACPTPWLQCLPCDCPAPPPDLVARLLGPVLSTPAGAEAPVLLAAVPLARRTSPADITAGVQCLSLQPTLALLHRSLADDLAKFVQGGGRRVGQWLSTVPRQDLAFDRIDDADAFINLNTPEDWERWQRRTGP